MRIVANKNKNSKKKFPGESYWITVEIYRFQASTILRLHLLGHMAAAW